MLFSFLFDEYLMNYGLETTSCLVELFAILTLERASSRS